ncbi:MAG TPA: serine hydrolase domain-containing protein [Thermoanaerobaculia bacterium]|jgi:CubicO group peptidase (beta-lactamase class C family)
MTRALLALLLILGQLPVAAATKRRAAQHPETPVAPVAIVTAARQAAETAMAAGVPAMQIAVSHHGRVIYSEAFGMTDRESATAATPRSVLRIGSITKQFTAAAILRLAERGALTLDDRIEKYVPEFDTRGRTITLRHLLTHTSGVARDPYPAVLTPAVVMAPFPRAQAIKTLNGKPFDFTPGSKWSYSNSGYLLLGYAIESITGRPYAEFIQNELALPLGLLDTGVCGTSNLPLHDGYSLVNGQWIRLNSFHTSGMVSSGALCSTASDLTRWAHLLATGRAMLPDSYATMTTAARLANNTVVPNSYALGVSVQKMFGHPAVSHGGAVPGFLSFLLYFPDQEIAVSVISNAFPFPADGNAELIAIALGKVALDAL